VEGGGGGGGLLRGQHWKNAGWNKKRVVN